MTYSGVGLVCLPVTGIGEVREGDDLAGMLAESFHLVDGDVLVVTSKVVSKAEGRVVTADKTATITDETDRVVAVRGNTSIVRTRHGLVMAAAGVDASNTPAGTVVLLPVDPDTSARVLREAIAADHGRNVAVVITDTSGRAWRNGQTDIAIGAAGLEVLHDYSGSTDSYGNHLTVTAPAVADEIAGAADLVKGKLSRSPAAVVRGLRGVVLPVGEHGPGAAALIRDETLDMFGYGARDAVLHAVLPDERHLRGFGAPATAYALADALRPLLPAEAELTILSSELVEVVVRGEPGPAAQRQLGGIEARLVVAAFAMGWMCADAATLEREPDIMLRFHGATP